MSLEPRRLGLRQDGEFPRLRVPYFGGPYNNHHHHNNKDPTI